MTNQERLAKLEEARKLIREVEFSYETDNQMRIRLYRAIVETFGFGGSVTHVMDRIKGDIVKEREGKPAPGVKQHDCEFMPSDFERCPSCRGSFSFSKPSGKACPWCGVDVLDAYEKSDTV